MVAEYWEEPGRATRQEAREVRSERECGRGEESGNVGTLDFTLRWEASNGFGLLCFS